ncbi:unnamed protein product [Prunus armeniaca]|uniref:Major facilitator superfamily (MFS) profile domain-containing protein n=1 Tax=Prunus armeniaca TaxID=36596 RepID=A0A6J5WTY7_PRUAR|nr:unnamed protein product [Prunus armeniaca]
MEAWNTLSMRLLWPWVWKVSNSCACLCWHGLDLRSNGDDATLICWTSGSVCLGLSSQQESFITSVVFAGMLVGAYSWGIVSDKHGRRKGFLITATNYFRSWISECSFA